VAVGRGEVKKPLAIPAEFIYYCPITGVVHSLYKTACGPERKMVIGNKQENKDLREYGNLF
jgi:hypothetical protein